MKVYLCELDDKNLFHFSGAEMNDAEREQGIVGIIPCYSSIKSAVESFEYLRNMRSESSIAIDIYEVDVEDNEILQINQSNNIIGLPQYLIPNLLLYETMLIPYDKYYSMKRRVGIYSLKCISIIEDQFYLFNCKKIDTNINSSHQYGSEFNIYSFSFIN